jgi:hypothetical protein
MATPNGSEPDGEGPRTRPAWAARTGGRRSRYPLLDPKDQVRPGMRSLPRGRAGLLILVAVILVAVVRAGGAKVTVPTVHGLQVTKAYASLHDAGLPVTIQHSFQVGSEICPYQASATAPAGGAHVKRGFAVTLGISQTTCATSPSGSSSASAPKRLVGHSLSAAIDWADAHHEEWLTTLPPLREANGPGLYANFLVLRQSVTAAHVLDLTVAAA